MKVLFVALGTEQLAISLLSAICKNLGHEVKLAFNPSIFHDRFNLEIPWLARYFDETDEVIKQIESFNPDIIAFSAITSTYAWMVKVAGAAKKLNPKVKVVFGGVHVSAIPDWAIMKPEIDFVVVGEGDIAFPKILDAVRSNDYQSPIVNTRFKNPDGTVVRGIQSGFLQDLDSLPFSDKMLWEDHLRVGDMYLIMASRGCPYRCTFCFNNFFAKLPEEKSGKYVRIRSVEHVIKELLWAKKRYQLQWVDFQDDVFTTSKPWLKNFLERYKKEIGLPFQILTHPRYMDDDIAFWLKDAGCEWVQMGVQSMDESFKKDSLMRYEKSDHIVEAIDVMNKNKLAVKVDHMFGLPDEPISAQQTALDLYSHHSPSRIQTFWTCYLPGTDMMNQAVEKGRLSQEQVTRLNEGHDFYFFRNTDNIEDPGYVKKYKAYELIFRAIPILPSFIRKRIKPRHVEWIPVTLQMPIASMVDVIAGVSLNNPDFKVYLYHNLFHLYKFAMKKMGFKNIKASKVNNENQPDLELQETIPVQYVQNKL